MRKIDFHIHTVASNLDSQFSFSMEKLKEYIETAKLDCIAITNHNLFARDQFERIRAATSIPIFPGIEVDLEGAQILVIADGQNIADFDSCCTKVSSACGSVSSISVNQFQEIFEDLSQYILIPHYDKKPAIKEQTLERLRPHVTAGEVSSPKKFIYCLKDADRLVPVYFSDCRIRDDLKHIPVRQTFIDCNELSFSTVKHCLRDKQKVSLSEADGNELFQIFEDGQHISTGLNVIIGGRSSGKSHTLQAISERFPNVRHIKQFALVARDEQGDQMRFNELLSQQHSLFSKDYLSELQRVVDDVIDIDLQEDERAATRYLESLLKHARETEKHDVFSRAVLFAEELYQTADQNGLRDLIASTKNLIRNEEFRAIIDKNVPLDGLKSLYVELMILFTERDQLHRKKVWVNELVQRVKEQLKIKTAAPTIADFDPYKTVLNNRKIEKFRSIVRRAQTPREIMRKQCRGFEIVAEVGQFSGAGELKQLSRSQVAFKQAFDAYDDPYGFLQALKALEERIPAAEYYKFFVKIEYKILNKHGFEASGGERSEFFLLQEIENAQAFDMLLIDEPESSFDNLFLKNDVNEIIKDISKTMPVVLVTHNNTVGVSIRPDYLLCTRKEVEGGEVRWRIYSGFPTDRQLSSVDGRVLKTWDVAMQYFEAGHSAYEERRRSYEDLED